MALAPMTFLRFCATWRGIAATAVATLALGLISHLVLAPAYREVSGFAPFDVQFPLSPFAIAVELGGYAEKSATAAYTLFAAVDFAYQLAMACLVTLVWVWLFAKVPIPIFAFLKRGGILLVPFYGVTLDLAAKIGFFRLVGGLAGSSYATTVDFCASAHRLESALIDIRYYLTAVFLLIVALRFLLRQTSRRASSGSAFPS
jgi:hypothetical protein